MNYFSDINQFYNDFYKILNRFKSFLKKFYKVKEMNIKSPHYSEEDIKFRLVRDIF